MLDPDEYQHAKKRLKKAVLEHYRALQMLHNYRVRSRLTCDMPPADESPDLERYWVQEGA